ncbi:histidine phosphatase family protein [Longispora albida]|uniref:histidine phosphatase family protein n=1 Tax=Longispora albida TaxID=203523 RepID=UPI0003790DAD|nr:histidine phosphatase family protein [Longispora albida]
MRLLLVRHGESGHHRLGLVSGRDSCPGLTSAGREQAAALRDRLAALGTRADVVLWSTVARARETAEILLPAFGEVAVAGEDCDLCEIHIGEGDGLTTGEFAARYGTFDPLAEPARPLSPGGETWQEFTARVDASLSGLARRYPGKTVVAVTHAGYVVWAFMRLFGVPRPGTGARLDPGFTSVTEWRWDAGGGYWTMGSYNDLTHLA